MVEWAQMKNVMLMGLGMLVLTGWIYVAGGGRIMAAERQEELGRPQVAGRLVANPVLRVPKLERSVFAPTPSCHYVQNCLD